MSTFGIKALKVVEDVVVVVFMVVVDVNVED
jgi:hypothetical protein